MRTLPRSFFATIRLFVLVVGLLCTQGCVFLPFYDDRPYILYTIARGDTLYEIGRRFGVAPDDLESFNDIDDPRALTVGVQIKIPYRGRPPRVVSGENKNQSTQSGADRPPSPASSRTVKISQARKYIGRLRWPVPGGTMNSRFGSRWLSFHEGIDISAPEGTPVYAAHDGIVVYSDDSIRGYGNVIVVKGDGLLTVYGHNRRNRVDRGDYVRAGERIADLGQTGKATGPHLHYETRVRDSSGRNVAVDPLVFYAGR